MFITALLRKSGDEGAVAMQSFRLRLPLLLLHRPKECEGVISLSFTARIFCLNQCPREVRPIAAICSVVPRVRHRDRFLAHTPNACAW